MDPDANWREQQEILDRLARTYPPDPEDEIDEQIAEDVEQLIELHLALKGWLARGGFPPKAWTTRGP